MGVAKRKESKNTWRLEPNNAISEQKNTSSAKRVPTVREFGRVQRVLEASVGGCIRNGTGNSKSGGGHLVAINEHGDAGHVGQTPRPAPHIRVPRKHVANCRRIEGTPGGNGLGSDR